jgi:hypothetical protein
MQRVKIELHLSYSIRRYGVVLNVLSTEATLTLPFNKNLVTHSHFR